MSGKPYPDGVTAFKDALARMSIAVGEIERHPNEGSNE